jgi:hypothetical protein
MHGCFSVPCTAALFKLKQRQPGLVLPPDHPRPPFTLPACSVCVALRHSRHSIMIDLEAP